MNKKNLSVVMAGAMLATSVAPVLADTTNVETYDVTKGNAGLLIDKLDTLFTEAPKFDKYDSNTNLRNQSVYAYQIRKKGDTTWKKDLTSTADTANLGTTNTEFIKNAAATADEYEIRVIDRGHRTDEDGKIVSTGQGDVDFSKAHKYTKAELETEKTNFAKADYGTTTKEGNYFKGLADMKSKRVVTSFTTTNAGETAKLTLASGVVIEFKAGESYELDFKAPVDSQGKSMDLDKILNVSIPAADVYGFKTKAETVVGSKIEITVLHNINLINGDTQVVYNTNDLYDGFMLTNDGHELLREINEVKNTKSTTGKGDVKIDTIKTSVDSEGNNYSVKITITNKKGDVKVVTVKGDNKDRLTTLVAWLNQGYANVDILAGDNRYATAVEIAKTYLVKNGQYADGTSPSDKTKDLNEIILVNGEALVDGLAAAPYAKKKEAPILLTATNSLPKETKDYLKELLEGRNHTIGNPSTLPTITIIGGTSVVSSNVVNELKDMGFKVNRIAGDNREQTSLEVAEAIGTKTNAFVVGAEGEADAMSIAAYAASTETPIIVSKSKKGLSTMALNDLSKFTNNVTIIGGESAVPTVDEEALVDSLGENKVDRIAGSNRQETNAMVIKKYHKNYTDVLVAKDGQRNKTDLVDALPVSIFASVGDGATRPIVLATDKISDAQVNQVVLNANKSQAKTVYQIGGGVDRSVIEKIVTKMGLNK